MSKKQNQNCCFTNTLLLQLRDYFSHANSTGTPLGKLGILFSELYYPLTKYDTSQCWKATRLGKVDYDDEYMREHVYRLHSHSKVMVVVVVGMHGGGESAGG